LGQGVAPQYVPPDHVVYGRGGSLFATPFDTVRLETTGSPVSVVDNVKLRFKLVPEASFSRVGSFVYIPAGGKGKLSRIPLALVWVDRTGAEQALNAPVRPYSQPRLAP